MSHPLGGLESNNGQITSVREAAEKLEFSPTARGECKMVLPLGCLKSQMELPYDPETPFLDINNR